VSGVVVGAEVGARPKGGLCVLWVQQQNRVVVCVWGVRSRVGWCGRAGHAGRPKGDCLALRDRDLQVNKQTE
jgi:hypothetical protein